MILREHKRSHSAPANHEEPPANPNQRKICKITEMLFQNVKVTKGKERLGECHRLKESGEPGLLHACLILDWVLDQERDISGKTEEIQINSLNQLIMSYPH